MATVRREGDQSARQVNRSLDSIGSKLTRLGFLAKAAFSSAIVVGARQAVREFALLEGATAKFNVVFGHQSNQMHEWVETVRQRVPLATREIVQSTAALQDLLVPMGIARNEAMGMTQEWFELAAALSAFNDVPVDQALQAIQSAIAGQSRPLRQFGIDVRETALQQTALEEGLIKSGEAMTESARQQALLIQAYRQSKDAVDGYEDQLGSTLMIEQELQASYKDTIAVIGEGLQPAYKEILGTLQDILSVASLLSAEGIQWLVEMTREASNVVTPLGRIRREIMNIFSANRQAAQTAKELNEQFDKLMSGEGDFDFTAFGRVMVGLNQRMEDTARLAREMGVDPESLASYQTAQAHMSMLQAMFDAAVESQKEMARNSKDYNEETEETLKTISDFEDRISDLRDSIKNTFDRNEIIEYQDEIRVLERRIDSLLGKLKPDTPMDEPVFDFEQALKDADEAMEEFLNTTEEGEFDKIPTKFEEMSDASRLFTRTLADGLNQVLFQARSVSEALDGIIRQLGSRALLAGLASLFGGSAVSFGAAFFGGFRQSGGAVTAGRGYVVGESGPELFVPDSGGSVISNDQLRGNVQKIHVHVTGEFQDRGDALRAVVAEQTRIIERLQ